jgi:hypothetical protein
MDRRRNGGRRSECYVLGLDCFMTPESDGCKMASRSDHLAQVFIR